MADDKKIAINTFTDGVDSDTADTLIKSSFARSFLNFRIFAPGTKGKGTNILGNTLIYNNLPAGNNVGIGWGKNEEKGKLYYFNYNDQNYHGIYAYDIITQAVTPVLQNLIDTNNVDILKFSKDFLINHVDIVNDNLLYWVDGLNKARKTNIYKCIDKSQTGYGTVITEDFITAYKQTGVYAPTCVYYTDLTRTSNYVYGLQFKFCYRFYYDDGEQSNCSDFSGVPLPPNESYLGVGSISFNNNCIQVTMPTGSKLVVKIELLVKINDADFVSCIILNKSQLNIADNGSYTYNFYNDGAYVPVDNVKVNRPYSFLPRIPYCQSFVKVAMTYANASEGFSPVAIAASLAITFVPFYLPNGTISQLNNPLFTSSLTSNTQHGGIFNSWWTTVTHFEIGDDVKKGNVFSINAYGGNGNKSWNYTATVADTAVTVASQIKNWLRTIDAVGTGTVSNEVTDGSGNALWDFTIEAHEGKNSITFSTSVTPVNYSTLLDDGLSINTIKMGSSRKYAIVYDDDDGRTSLAYTTDTLLAVTPFETQTVLGQSTPIGLQQPIHTITITSQPPVWAKYWRLVRTNDTATFIQLLIQQVNTVVVANEPTYLDMIVGSLFTYQAIHPDTILQYEFQRGDRLRLISNENTTPPTLYTPFFETEILNYLPEVTQFINADITVSYPASNTVTTTATVDAGDIGKYIIINDVQRMIVTVGSGTYTLDEPISPNVTFQTGTPSSTTYPNYTLKDIRGTIRIAKPPSTYTVVNQSLVEIYRPQQNLNNTSYLNFNDFQCKFPINNWGTPQAAHVGNIQSQDGTNPVNIPCIVQVTQGDAYVRNRAMPSNNQNPNPQVIIDQVCDPNFSDFYQSNLYSTGRVYPQDQAYGVVSFNQRVRFSNNYIADTQINGLNDFDNTDRKDYNDPYGSINLSRFRRGLLYLFKALKTTWTPVDQNILVDNSGQGQLASSDNLLNNLQYAVWDGGIGSNGEAFTEYGDYMYIGSPNSGVILRIAHDGSEPISSLYLYDQKVRNLMSLVSRNNLRLYMGFDKLNNEMIASVPPFINYIFNNTFNAGDWQTVVNQYPAGTTFTIIQQPANATATIVGNQIQITGTNTLGNDYFKFQGTLPDSSTTPVMNFCFTVIQPAQRTISYRVRSSTVYCIQSPDVNPFSFIPATGQPVNTEILSNTITVSGPTVPVPISITGGQYSINGGAFTSSAGTINAGDTVKVRVLSSMSYDTSTSCTLTMSGQTGTFTATTLYVNAFTFAPVNNAPLSTTETSNSITVSGQNISTYPISITGGEYSINGGAYTSAPGTTSIGDVITVQCLSSSSNSSITSCTLTILDKSSTFVVTTLGASAATGILTIDIFDTTTINVYAYVNTPAATIPYQEIVYTGQNFLPYGSTDAANAWALSSDLNPPQPTRRFEFNLQKLMANYPAVTDFEFIVAGRDVSAGTIRGSYVNHSAADSSMIMNGSPGTYLPSISGTELASTPYSGYAVVGGADGTYGLGVGAVILTFNYNVSTMAITLT